jgi:hypothetical protein
MGRTSERSGSLLAEQVGVISDRYWTRRFQRDPAIVGRVVTFGAAATTIVGVAPPGFYGESMQLPPDGWLPLARSSVAANGGYDDHHTYWLDLIGRLTPNVGIAQANAEINARLREFLIAEAGGAPPSARRDEIAHTGAALASGRMGRSVIRDRAATPLALLFALVALVLLSASASVANLLLARSAMARHRTAIRAVLCASRSRLARAAFAETTLLLAPGAAIGAVAARLLPRALLPLVTTAELPVDTSLDVRTFCVLAGAVLCATAIASAGPVWHALWVAAGRETRPWLAGRVLVIVQVSMAMPPSIVRWSPDAISRSATRPAADWWRS